MPDFMNPALWILVASLALCVALSAYFSCSETAYSAVNKIKLKTMSQEGNARAALALELAEQYDRLLTTILIGNNVVNIAGTSIATVLFTGLVGNMGATLSTVVMTLLILLFGEISPKTLAKESPEAVAIAVSSSLKLLMVLLAPLGALFGLWRRLLSRVFKPSHENSYIEAELMTMVDTAESEGDMDAHESELIRSAIEFNDQDVTNIMTPRVDITALEDTATIEDAAALFRETQFSRMPVYHEDIDHVVGILHEKDLYAAIHDGVTGLTSVMQRPVYAPSSLKVSKLLKMFQSSKTHMVVVLDEFGGTEGIVTMEDALEELVGEIYDEHDDVNQELTTMEDGSLLVDGSMQLSELLERFDLQDTFEADTVGGWVAEVLERIPDAGMQFDSCGLHGQVEAMDKRRVTQVRIWRDVSSEESKA